MFKGFLSKERRSTIFVWALVSVLSASIGSGITFTILRDTQAQNGGSETALTDTSNTTSNSPTETVNVNLNTNLSDVVKKVNPDVMAVVNYNSNLGSSWFGMGGQSDSSNSDSSSTMQGVGTGVLFKKDSKYAYIVTNNHVVEGSTSIELVVNSGKHLKATIVGTDPYTDIAVLKTSASYFNGIAPATFGNSDNIQVGEPVIAIGTPEGLDFQDSVTSGIISAKERTIPLQDEQTQQIVDYENVVQTDAAINPGNSGGPLVDALGDVIAINSSKISDPTVQGMGFGIPSNEVMSITSEILATGHAYHPSLGISAYDLSMLPIGIAPNSPVTEGVYVQAVDSRAAKQAGLQPQDIIVAIDGKPVASTANLRTYLFQMKPGSTVTLTVYRGNQKVTLHEALTSKLG